MLNHLFRIIRKWDYVSGIKVIVLYLFYVALHLSYPPVFASRSVAMVFPLFMPLLTFFTLNLSTNILYRAIFLTGMLCIITIRTLNLYE